MINIIASCCIEDDGKILMVQQNKEEYRNLWDFPGGKVEENEDIITAAKREVKEETGYKVSIDNLLFMQNYISDKGVILIIYFTASLLDSVSYEYNMDEIKDKKWMTIDEIRMMPEDLYRGKKDIKKVIDKIELNETYSLNIIDIHNLLI